MTSLARAQAAAVAAQGERLGHTFGFLFQDP